MSRLRRRLPGGQASFVYQMPFVIGQLLPRPRMAAEAGNRSIGIQVAGGDSPAAHERGGVVSSPSNIHGAERRDCADHGFRAGKG